MRFNSRRLKVSGAHSPGSKSLDVVFLALIAIIVEALPVV
jgi:hypothetical protein